LCGAVAEPDHHRAEPREERDHLGDLGLGGELGLRDRFECGRSLRCLRASCRKRRDAISAPSRRSVCNAEIGAEEEPLQRLDEDLVAWCDRAADAVSANECLAGDSEGVELLVGEVPDRVRARRLLARRWRRGRRRRAFGLEPESGRSLGIER